MRTAPSMTPHEALAHADRSSRLAQLVRRALPFGVILVAWWLLTSGFHLVPPFKLPAPEAVLETAVDLYREGVLLDAVGSSILRMSLGFVVGTAFGISLGVLAGTNRYVADFLNPVAMFFQAMAGPTWIPLAVLWFGLSWTSVAFIVFNTVFFLVFYNTLMGVETISPNLVNSVRTLGGRRWQIVWEVLVPGALPSIANGLRLGVGYGWRALIAAEIIASGQGLGVLIWEGQRYFRVADIVLGLLLIGVISLAIDRLLLRRFEAATIERWGVVSDVRL